MAYPSIIAEAWTPPSTTNSTSYPVAVPTGSAGEVVECEVGSTSNGALSTSSTGWRLVRQWRFASGLSGALFRKKAGTTGADSLTVTSATSARFNAHTVRLPYGTRTYASPIATATATGTNSNPPIVDHRKASREVLYTAVRWGAGTVVPTVTPSGYGTLQNNPATSGGVSQTYVTKTATSASDDPGTFTSASALWGCITIARWIDTVSPLLGATKAKLLAGTADVIALADGDSQEAGAAVLSGSTDTMGSNVSSICRNAVRAANLQAMPGSRASLMGSGGLTSAADVKAWDTRLTSGASHALSQAVGAFTLGGSAHTLGTSGHKWSFAPGEAFDRVEVLHLRSPAYPAYTVDVNGGTAQTITAMTGADGIVKSTFNLSGNAAAVVNINGTGAGGYFLGVRVYLTTQPRVHFINFGWYGATTANLAENSAFYSALKMQAAVAADVTFMTAVSNDAANGLTSEQSLDNLRLKWLVALATGECIYTIPNYFSGGNEAAQDALWDQIADAADELGVAVNRLTLKSGFTTSYAATVAAGNLVSGNNHMTAQGHAVAGEHDRLMIDVVPQNIAPTGIGPGGGVGAPTVGSATPQTISPAGIAPGASLGSPTLTQPSGGTLWTPADYAPGVMDAWHDPSDPANITLTSGKVSADADLSGNGYHETQSTAANRPALAAADLNGLDVENFAYSSGAPYLVSSLPANPAVASFLAVVRWSGIGPATIYGASAAGGLQVFVNGGNLAMNVQSIVPIGSTSGAPIAANTWAIVAATYDAATGAYAFRVNGAALASGTALYSLTSTTTVIGMQQAGGSAEWTGKLAERGRLATADLDEIHLWEGYAAWKYGLEGNLDAGHPYKSAAPTVGGGGDQAVSPTGIASAAAVGSPTLTQPAQSVAVTGIAPQAAVGSPVVTQPSQTVQPAAIAPTGAVGSPTITQPAQSIAPTGIAPTLAMGAPVLTQLSAGTIYPDGIGSAAAVGQPTVLLATPTVSPVGIDSTAAVGSPVVSSAPGQSIAPVGIAAGGGLGQPTLTQPAQSLAPAGIPGAAAVGAPTVARAANSNLVVVGIASTAAVGEPWLTKGDRPVLASGRRTAYAPRVNRTATAPARRRTAI